VIDDYNKGITNPNGVLSGIARHSIYIYICTRVGVMSHLCSILSF
jgi:hypothetical protein